MARHKLAKTGAKRKHHAKRSHRRRRVGAAGSVSTLLMNGLSVGGGAVAVNELSILAGNMFPSLMASPVLTGIVEIGLGFFTAMQAKTGWLMYAGLGAMGNGVITVGKGTNMIGGPPQTMSYQFANRRALGDPRLQFIAGMGGPTTRIGDYPNNFPVVAGRETKRRYTS